jgi:hypothetical protein
MLLLAIPVGWFLAAFLVGQETYRFYLPDPHDDSLRARLLTDQLAPQLAEFERRIEEKGLEDSGVNSDEDLWPYDTTRLVIGIQRYVLEKGGLPENLGQIETSGLLDLSKLSNRYTLKAQDGMWSLLVEGTELEVAKGN